MKLKWIPWILSIVFMVFVLTRITEVNQITEAFQKGNMVWIFVALLLQVGYFLLLGRVYQLSFRAAGMRRGYFSVLPVVMATVFANTLTPSAGIAGTAIFVKEGRRHDYTSIRSTTGFVLETIFQQFGFILVMVAALFYLLIGEGEALIIESAVVGMVFFLITVQVIFLFIAYKQPSLFQKLLDILSTVANWIVVKVKKKSLVSKSWSKNRSKEMVGIVAEAMSDKKLWILTVFTVIIMQMCMMLTFFALFHAFGQEIDLAAGISSFIASSIAGSILLGPQGIGLVEAGLTLLLTHYGIPAGPAAMIAITYRVLNFWLPLLAGFFFFRWLGLFEEE